VKQLPRQVDIGGFKYKINLYDEVKNEKGEDLVGQCNHNTLELKLSNKYCVTPDQAKNTIIHEILHAIFEDREIKQDERTVTLLANGLRALAKQNPDIWRYLGS